MQANARQVVFIFALLLFPTNGFAQAEPEPSKPARLFDAEDPIEITFKAPWRRLQRQASSPEEYPASISYTDANGQPVSFTLGVTTRGLTRRDLVCDFPPLKLWFDKDQTKGTSFRGQGSLKMVTHCQANKRFEQYYIKEFLSYRIYNQITPFSFRVRPLMVSYVDSERPSKPVVRFGFLIEDIDDVAERNGLVELEIPRVSHRRLDADETSNYMVFQYLIGNLDWSATSGRDPVECCHNTKLIGTAPEATPVFPIPYDLDSSGLVNTHYAAPPENLPVRNIRQRLFRGFCAHNASVPAALERFMAKRQAIGDLFRDASGLTSKNRGAALKYLEDFFRILEKPGSTETQLTDKCRG